jgi:hypothetical protein
MDSASRYRAGNGPIFSASKAPPGPGLEQSCELPFGCLWTPLSSPSDDSDWAVHHCKGAALPPVTCLTCCAYLNIYAELNVDENTWICPLCFGKNVTTPAVLQSSITQVPGIEYRQTVLESDEKDSLTIILVMDQNLPQAEAQAIGVAVQKVLEAKQAFNDGNTRLQLGIITFAKQVHVYQVGNASHGLVSADVFSKHQQLSDDHLSGRPYLATLHENALECLWRTLSAAYGISAEAESQDGEDAHASATPLSRFEQLKRNKEERIRRELDETTTQANLPQSPWTKSVTEKVRPHRGTRNVGEAIQTAIDLATAAPDMPARTARIFVFTNGCPNFGDGSVVDTELMMSSKKSSAASQKQHKLDIVNPAKLARAIEFFALIGKASSEVGVAMDVFCSGSSELALAAYQALVESSSGYVLPHLVFEAEPVARNLHFLYHHTFVPGVTATDGQWIDGCILDIRIPRYVFRKINVLI